MENNATAVYALPSTDSHLHYLAGKAISVNEDTPAATSSYSPLLRVTTSRKSGRSMRE